MIRVDLRSSTPKYDGPLLRLDGLCVHFESEHGEVTEAAKHVSPDLHVGERFVLADESSSGKSVTALLTMRLLADAQYSGRVLLEGHDLLAASEHKMRGLRGTDVVMVFQGPMTAFNPLYTIGNQIVETPELHEGLDRRAIKACAIAPLECTGTAEAPRRFDVFPHQLSGDQRQCAMIAMVLVRPPKLLLADESTTALDVTVCMQTLQLLRELQAGLGMVTMLIMHDLNMVRALVERVGMMERGVLVKTSNTADVPTASQHPYTVRLSESRPQCGALPLVSLALVLLEVDKLTVTYERHRPRFTGWLRTDPFTAVDAVSLQLCEDETLGIVGESGPGKTTLAQTLLGLQTVKSGDLRFPGNSLLRTSYDERRAMRVCMQAVFQDPYGPLSPRMTIEEIVGEGLALHQPHVNTTEHRHRVIKVLREAGLDRTVLGRYPHEFSGGQRQRVAIAWVLTLKSQLLVLDESTSALGASIQQQVLSLSPAPQKKYNLSHLSISHDLVVIRAMSHCVVVMKDGKVVEEDDTRAVLASPSHPHTCKLMVAASLIPARDNS